MAKGGRKKSGGHGGKLYTLSDVSKKTGISMPTLQRYKKLYQRRIPSVGKGRKQRYPQEALKVFKEIKKENLAKRGRPRKTAARGRKKAAGRRKGVARSQGDLMTLTEVGKRTGISYPTLVRYVKQHGKKIPHTGRGRKRRYPPAALKVFRDLRAKSRRGRKPGASRERRKVASGAPRGQQEVARRLASLEREVKKLRQELKKPIKVTVGRR